MTAVAAGLERVLADPTFELIPLKNVREQAAALPRGATVSVTASPAKGIEATVELAIELESTGLHAIPHLSARMIRNRAHLDELLTKMADAGIDRAFVVGGDADEPGEFLDGLSLLRAMADLGKLPSEVGCPCYPQGHMDIPTPALEQALRDKAPFVVVFATPKFCQSRACGPVVDVVDEMRREFASRGVRFIHVEVYEDNDPQKGLNPWMKEWNLQTEPWVFVVGADGRIKAKFEGSASADELRAAIEPVVPA